jgi:DNA-binding IclR family transcriptional regulator
MRRMLFVLAAAAVAGCASRPEPEASFAQVEHFQEVMVQTIPRGCWVDHNSGYVGVAPIAVRVRSSERGRPLGINAITVTHSSGAWERKMVRYGEPVPERMLFDLRGLSGVGPALSFGP